jgi:predicted metal-dependent hydrolase
MLFKKAAPLKALPLEDGMLRHDGREIPYSIIRSKKRRRTVALSVKHGAGLRMLVPMRISGGDIKRILDRRADWIAHQYDRLVNENILQEQTLAEGQPLPFLGKDHTLFFDTAVATPYKIESQIACSPENASEALTQFYKDEAYAYLRARLDYWANALNLRYTAFGLSNARRLWGSCSGLDAIRINWRIIMAPPEVIDYLLVHELCHVAYKSHGVRFWGKVAGILPDYKSRQKILRQFEGAWLGHFRKPH